MPVDESLHSHDPAQEEISIVPANTIQFFRRIDELVELHLAAMNYAQSLFRQRKTLWLSNTSHHDFLCHLAVSHPSGTTVNLNDRRQRSIGVCFSFRGSPNTWWHRQVFQGLRDIGHSQAEAQAILSDYSELSEIHVAPQAQGKGIGRSLLRTHCATIPQAKIMLSTPEVPGENNGAWRLYRSMGFKDVLRQFYFPADTRPFAILELPVRSN